MTNFLCFVIALHVVSFANLYVIKNLNFEYEFGTSPYYPPFLQGGQLLCAQRTKLWRIFCRTETNFLQEEQILCGANSFL